MKIFLTGYRGFIGSHLMTALINAGHDVKVYEWSEHWIPNIEGFDWVMHVGANSSTMERNIEKIMFQNYDFSVALYETAAQQGINFQYASSASVYGLGTQFTEDAPVDPRNPYAWTKYLFERYVRQNSRNIITQGFRYFNVYGPEGEERKGNQASPFAKFKKQAEEQGYVEVFDGPSAQRDFVHVSRIVDVHLKMLNINESGIWNVGTGQTMSFRDIAEKYTTNIVEIPMPDVLKSNYQYYTCADITKLKRTLGE